MMTANTANSPLMGVRVLDFTQVVAGPYCTMMLADMGADVVKIEQPGHGDDLRRTVPYRGREGHQDYFNALNRSKRSVALDLKLPSDQATALQLLDHADVLVENFSPGTMDKLGLGRSVAHARNARLIYCSLSGFGQTGPYRNRPALDPMIQAVTGLMSVTGQRDAEPTMVGAPISDVMAGMFAAFAIVSALRLVNEQSGGQYIDLSMQDATLAALGTRMGETLQAGLSPTRLGNENPLRVPASTYRTNEGHHLAVIVLSEAHWPPFCRALDKPDWIEHPSYRTMPLRLQHRDEINLLVARRFAEQPMSHWRARLEAHDVPYAQVNDYTEALADPQVAHRELIRALDHPLSGSIKVVGPPWRMSVTRTVPYPPPLLGQHTGEVMREWLGIAPGRKDASAS